MRTSRPAETLETLLPAVRLQDFSKMEADRLELEITPFSLREVVESAATTVQVKAEEKGLPLVVRVPPDIPRQCVGDPARLKRVLLNLLSNGMAT